MNARALDEGKSKMRTPKEMILAIPFALLPVLALADDDDDRRSREVAVVSGAIECETFGGFGNPQLTLAIPAGGDTGDPIGGQFGLLGGERFSASVKIGGTCTDGVATVVSSAPAACTLGSATDEFGVTTVPFVCFGRENRVISAVAEWSTAVIALPPPSTP